MTLAETFILKKRYDREVPNDFFNQNFIDFDKLNRYGIVDENNNLIFPNAAYLKPFAGSGGNVQVLSFVARAYDAMKKDIDERVKAGKWESDSVFPFMKPVGGNSSVLQSYDDFMVEQYQTTLPKMLKNRKLSNFASFLTLLQDYLVSVNWNYPYTFTGMIERRNNPAGSGLQIELFSEDKNDIETKMKYIQDPGFKRFLLVAEKYGFYVNRNTPWVIMANLNSPAMLGWAVVDNNADIDKAGIIKKYYYKASDFSYNFFVQYLVGTYNAIATSEPRYTYVVKTEDPCKEYNKIIIERKQIEGTQIKVEEEKNRELLQLLYFTIRFWEVFSSKKKYSTAKRIYFEEKNYTKKSFGDFVESILGAAKNSSKLFL